MTRSLTAPPNNSSSASFTSVGSSTGFNAGEYIYNKNGDFGIVPDNGLTTGSFNIPTSGLTNYSTSSGGVASIYNALQGANAQGGSRNPKCSAVLSNGNIVFVYAYFSTGQVWAKIDTAAGVAVVAPFVISSTYLTNSRASVGVVALAGGGFVTYWQNSATGTVDSVNYAVNSNTGSVVTAAQQDATSGLVLPAIDGCIAGASLPNGGFVLAFTSTTLVISYRIYGLTGLALYAWATVGTTNADNQVIGIFARSDSSFCIAAIKTSTTILYAIFSATNTSIINTTFSVTATASASVSVGTLTNDTFVIAYANNGKPKFRLLPTGNTLGSEVNVAFAASGFNGSTSTRSRTTYGLSGGNFVYAFLDDFGFINYSFYDVSGSAQAASQTMMSNFPYGSNQSWGITIVDLPSSVMVMFTNGSQGNLIGAGFIEQSYFQISKSTYLALNLGTSFTGTVGQVSAAISAYARNSSTPNSARFFATTTQTLSLTLNPTSGTLAPTVIDASPAGSVTSCTLNNGAGFVMAYTLITGVNKIAVYDSAGNFQRSFSTNATSPSNYANTIRICTLTTGNIAVVVATSSTTVQLSVYDPTTGTLVSTASRTGSNVYSGASYNFAIAGLSNGRFVIGLPDVPNTNGNYFIYSSTCSLLASFSDSLGVPQNLAISATPNGQGFWSTFFTTTYNSYVARYYKNNSGDSFAVLGGLWLASNANIIIGCNSAVTSNNILYFAGGTSGTTVNINTIANGMTGLGSALGISADPSSSSIFTMGTDGLGRVLALNVPNGTATSTLYIYNANENASTSTSFATSALSGGVYPQPSLTPLYGPFVLISYLNSNAQPVFSIINTLTATYTLPITAGITAAVTALPTTPDAGYVFTGVSITPCAAGGTTQVQTNGLARLNSSYNAAQTTTYFDSTSPSLTGTKGFVNGLNVNLQGNT